MKKVLLTVAAACAAGVVTAATNYVDCAMGDYAGHDGSSWSLAFETIQQAVDAAGDNDTILVAPGVYRKGGQVDTVDGVVSNRVSIGKSLTLKSARGSERTVIRGELDLTSEARTGAASMRCIGITDDSIDVVIEGFTLTGGSTPDGANVRSSWGAGVCGYSRAVSPVFVVDCIVTNNWGSRGVGVYGCTSVRTLFRDNHATGAGVSIRCGNAANCIFDENATYSGGRSAADSMYRLLNCTFVNCKYPIKATKSYNPVFRNCLVAATDSTMITDNDPAATLQNFKSESPMFEERLTEDSRDWAGNVAPMLVAPIFGDYRPVAGGPADAAGDVTHLAMDFLPAKYRTTDFFGNPRTTGETICLGAIEGAVAVQGGLVYFNFDSSKCWMSVNGRALYQNLLANSYYAHAATWPVQWRVTPNLKNGASLFGCQQKGVWSVMRFVDSQGGFFMTPPEAGQSLTNFVTFAGLVRYVAEDGDDGYTGSDLGSEEHPYATIQAAVDAVNTQANGLVYVKGGTYATGETYQQSATNRVSVNRGTRLVAVDGPEKTFIVGAKDASSSDAVGGCGPAAIRCVGVKGGVQASLCGFTLTGGYSPINASYGGGAFMANNTYEVQFIDCVITNNFGSRGAATYGGWCIGCHIARNTNVTGGNGISRNGVSSGCVYYLNGSISSVAGWNQRCYNCTFMTPGKTTTATDAQLYNCIVRNSDYIPVPTSDGYLLGNIFYNVKTIAATSGFTVVDPLLVDASTGDWRLLPASPAIGAGVVAGVPNFALYTVGGYGNAPVMIRDGKPTVGACHKPVVAVEIAARVSGEITPSGTQYVDQGATLTVTATGSEKRKFLGFYDDGTFVDTQGARSYVFTAPSAYCAAPIALSAAYATNWYVNADSSVGSDANDGWTPETARRTLAKGVADAVSGDVVHAAAGVYDDGDDVEAKPYVLAGDTCPDLRARVVVPAGVTLEGADRDTTVIEGRLGDCAGGCGTNALRCVYLCDNATVRRFTIRQGRTAPREAANYADDNYWGAGVRGVAIYTTLVEDCFLTNCCAPRGSALIYTRARNCRIVGNTSQANGSAARNSALYGCYVGANTGSSPLIVNEEIVNCVYAADNSANCGDWNATGPSLAANSVFYTSGSDDHHAPKHMTNVVLIGTAKMTASVSESGTATYETDAPLLLDGQGRPTIDSPLVDAGETSLAGWATDLAGGQRVYNGAVDVGCYEFDWREKYRGDLGFDGTVTAVSPEVREVGSRVFLPGGSLDLSWNVSRPRGRRNVTAEVTGTGALAVYRGDEEEPLYVWTAATPESARTFKMRNTVLGALDLSFVYTPGADDAGGAYITGLEEILGTVLSIR